jgi:RNA polymerase primary sigma factor
MARKRSKKQNKPKTKRRSKTASVARKKAKKEKKANRHSKKSSKVNAKLRESNAKTTRLLAKGKERGFVTYDEIIREFPSIENDIFFLDSLYDKLHQAGIDILEGGGMLNLSDSAPAKPVYGGRHDIGGTAYDSIQIYLREIGQYPLIAAKE